MNDITEKIYLWVANDAGLYDAAQYAEDGDSLRESFSMYIQPWENGSVGMLWMILGDLLNDVDWQAIYDATREDED